jgi:hypothetical protein
MAADSRPGTTAANIRPGTAADDEVKVRGGGDRI